MNLHIIAVLVDQIGSRFETVGYKVLNSKSGDFKLLSEKTIKDGDLVISNASFVNGTLKGTCGDFKRYTHLDIATGKAVGGRSLVILGKNSEGYFLTVPYPDSENKLITTMSYNELCSHAYISPGLTSGVKIANALCYQKGSSVDSVVRPSNNSLIIRPMKGDFKIITESPSFIERCFYFGKKQGTFSKDWRVRLVRNGDCYGNDYCLTNKEDTLVEFYDLCSDPKSFPIGQFVCRYYVSTLINDNFPNGLSLYGSIPVWSLTLESINDIVSWLKKVYVPNTKV